MDYEKRRRKQIVDERGALPWWWRRWEPAIYPDATAPSIRVRAQDARRAAAGKRGALMAQLQACIAELERTRDGEDEAPSTGFVKDATFTYRNKRGGLSKHSIVRVARGWVYTHEKKRFKVRTLERLSQRPNPVVELL
jgi:hypothetical protein